MDPTQVNREMPIHAAEVSADPQTESIQPVHLEDQQQAIVDQVAQEVTAATGEVHSTDPDAESKAILRGVLIPPADTAQQTHENTEAVINATLSTNYRSFKLRHIPLLGPAINWFMNLFGKKTAASVEHMVTNETRTGDSNDFRVLKQNSQQRLEQTQAAALQQVAQLPPAA